MTKQMEYHVGERVHEVIKQRPISLKEVAEILCISRQGLNSLLKRPNMDCARLYLLSVLLEHNFFEEIAYALRKVDSGALTTAKTPLVAAFDLKPHHSLKAALHFLHDHFNPDFDVEQKQSAPVVLRDIFVVPRLLAVPDWPGLGKPQNQSAHED